MASNSTNSTDTLTSYYRIVDSFELRDDAFFGGQWVHRRGASQAYKRTLLECRSGGPEVNSSWPVQPWVRYTFTTGTEVRVVGRPRAGLRMGYTLFSREGSMDEAKTEEMEGVEEPRPGLTIRDTEVRFADSVDLGKGGVDLFTLRNLSRNLIHTLTLFPTSGPLFLDYFAIRLPPSPDAVPPDSNSVAAPPGSSANPGISPDYIRTDRVLYQIDDTHRRINYFGTWEKYTPPREALPPAGESGREEVVPLVPVGGGWARTNLPGSGFEFDFDGDVLYGYGPIHAPYPPPESPSEVTIEFQLFHRANGTIAYGPFNHTLVSSERPPPAGAASSWSYDELFRARAVQWGTEWRAKVTVTNVTGTDQYFNLDMLTFGDDRAQRTQFDPEGYNNLNDSTNPNVAIIGGAIGGLIAVALFAFLCYWYRTKQDRARQERETEAIELQAAEEAERRTDWEGPTAEAAPPPWSPPGHGEEGDPPPPLSPVRDPDDTTQQGQQLPSPPPSPSPSPSPLSSATQGSGTGNVTPGADLAVGSQESVPRGAGAGEGTGSAATTGTPAPTAPVPTGNPPPYTG